MDDLEKISRETNHENSRLKAQVERLQVELKEYRKRLSWVSSGNSISPASSLANGNGNLRSQSTYNNNDFSFEFPKFGDLPSAHLARNGSLTKPQNYASGPYSLLGAQPKIPGVVGRGAGAPSGFNTYNSGSQSQFSNPASNPRGSDYRNGGVYSTADRNTKGKFSYTPADQGTSPYLSHSYENPIKNYTDSPSASSDSQQGHISSIGTSPEPTTNSPSLGKEDALHNKNGSRLHGPSECEQEFCKKLGAACGCADNPIPAAMGKTSPQSNGSNSTKSPQSNDGNKVANNDIFFNDDSSLGIDWMVQQNGGQFDPVLFGDYRDPQDAVLSQEFNGFFNDAFQLPDLGNLDNFDLSNPPAPKKDLVSQIDRTINSADDEVVPGEDRSQMLSCNKIWYAANLSYAFTPISHNCLLTSCYSLGIDSNRWTNSAVATLTSTAYVPSFEQRLDVQKAEWSSTGRTLMISWAERRSQQSGFLSSFPILGFIFENFPRLLLTINILFIRSVAFCLGKNEYTKYQHTYIQQTGYQRELSFSLSLFLRFPMSYFLL